MRLRIARKTGSASGYSPLDCEGPAILARLDDLIEWGEFMAAAGTELRIKYGLGLEPIASKQAEWARLTRQFIDRGYPREQAGDLAAKQLFPDYHTKTYASEADTIDTLLRLAEQK